MDESHGTGSSMSVPTGWIKAGSQPQEYDMGVDASAFHEGTKCGCIKSVVSKCSGFGTLMQGFTTNEFRGKRVRLSGWLKSEDVDGWAGMWMRVDGKEGQSKESLAFDNMKDRPTVGTEDWSKKEIVLDVPDNGEVIAFGALLHGCGSLWMDNFNFEIVGTDVPTTGARPPKPKWVNDVPTNLNFES